MNYCQIYSSPEERDSYVVRFLSEVMNQGEHCVRLCTEGEREAQAGAFRSVGWDVENLTGSGVLEITATESFFGSRDSFDPERACDVLRESVDAALHNGSTGMRIAMEPPPFLDSNKILPESWVAFLDHLNIRFSQVPLSILIHYDRSRFSPRFLRQVIRRHPQVVVDGQVYQNYYYFPPDDGVEDDRSGREVNRLLESIRDHELNERSLRESEERLALALEGAELGIWDWDPDTGKIVHNEQWAKMLGYSLDELGHYKDAWERLVHSDDKERVLSLLQKHLNGETPYYESEHRLRTKSGNWVWVHDRGKMVTVPGSDRMRVTGTHRDITVSRQAESAMRESEERFRSFVRNSPDIILSLDSSGTILFMNRDTDTGVAISDAIGREVSGFIQREDRSKALDALEKAFAGVEHQSLELTSICDEVYQTRFVPLKRNGGADEVMVIAVRITERKRMEAALQDSEARLRQVMDLVPHFIFAKDSEGRFILANRAVAKAYGTTSSEMIGKRDVDFASDPQEVKHFLDDDRKVMESGEPLFIQREVFTAAEGNRRILQTSKIPFTVFGSDEQAVLGVSIDITNSVRVEKALRASEELNRNIVDDAPLGILYLDSRGRIIFANLEMARMMDLPENNVTGGIGQRIQDVTALRKLWESNAVEPLLQGESVHDLEVEYESSYGANRNIKVFGSPHRTPSGEVDGAIIMCMDVTAFKELERQFIQAQKMEAVGRLVGGIAHDFNNLLTAISGQSELVLLSLEEGDPIREKMQEIMKTSGRASRLIRQLLVFSRRKPLSPKVIDLNFLIQDMEGMLHRTIGEDIDLRTSLQQDLMHLMADAAQMEQVIVNLVVNARDAMPRGGKLWIETSNVSIKPREGRGPMEIEPGDYVLIEVRDNGFGMSEEIKAKIFDPFYTTKPAGKGTGLGLSTVYGIIKQYNGHIHVRSEMEKGTSIRIYLRGVNVDEAAKKSIGETVTESQLNGKERILVAEDENDVREIVVDTLNRFGYEVTESRTGRDAYRLFRKMKGGFDLILSDIVMPEMGGPEFIDRVREEWPETKVIFMSGYPQNAVTERGTLTLDDPYLQKPFRPLDLVRLVRETLEEKKPA